jgi:hypothetical protein
MPSSGKLDGGLKGPALFVIKGIMKKKKVVGRYLELAKMPAQALKRRRSEPSAQQVAHVLGAQIQGHGADLLPGKRLKTDGAAPATDGTDPLFRLFDEWFGFPQDQLLLTLRTVRFAGDAIPRSFAMTATAARNKKRHPVHGLQSHAVHA